MPELLKNLYNRESVGALARDIEFVYPGFQTDLFLESVIDSDWEGLELKARMRQITMNLGAFLPEYREAIGILNGVAARHGGLFGIVFPDFVEVFGLGDWEVSMDALAAYTVHSTSEFAVRAFILLDEERMMKQMLAWSLLDNEHLRRFASEGCRPQLPWAQSLPRFKKDPSPILPILENLKADSSLYVRKSVANNLNDISKTHPDLVARLAREWYGENPLTDWIVKHGCRTLLKKGNREVLGIFSFDGEVEVRDFRLHDEVVQIGGSLEFSFSVRTDSKVRIEYGVDYVKSNGKVSRKIFQISESPLSRTYTKRHDFKDLSTRKHYAGVHGVALIVNGVERGRLEFELKKDL